MNSAPDSLEFDLLDALAMNGVYAQRVADLITHRHSYGDFESAFQHHGSDEIKVVLEWGRDQ